MAVVVMNPSWLVMAGGSRRSVSPANRKVSVLAAVAPGFVAGAVVGAAAGAVVAAAAAAGAVVGAAAGAVVGLGAAVAAGGGALVGAAGVVAGPHAASSPIPAATPARPRKRRRVSGDGCIVLQAPRDLWCGAAYQGVSPGLGNYTGARKCRSASSQSPSWPSVVAKRRCGSCAEKSATIRSVSKSSSALSSPAAT